MLDQWHFNQIVQEVSAACITIATELTRPSVLYRPSLRRIPIGWQAKFGGVMVTGMSPAAAMELFDKAWRGE